MIPAIIIISFILENIFSNLVSASGIFIPLFSLLSLIFVYPLFKDKNEFIITSLVLGLFYDIIITNTLFINTLIFLLIAYIIKKLYKLINSSLIGIIIISVISIIVYRTINYILIEVFTYNSINFSVLLNGIKNSLVLNIIFTIIVYYLLKFIYKKTKKKLYE